MNREDYSNDMSDEEALFGSIEKPSVFAVLVERYEEAFLRKARMIIKDDEEARDIVQEAFTKIYLAAPRFMRMPGASFKSWGYRIVINTAITHYRARRKKGIMLSLDDEDVAASVGKEAFEAPVTRESSDYVASILTRLPAHFSKILSLHFLEDMSHAEIARREGLSVSAVKARIHRAKQAFREEKQIMTEHAPHI